LSALVSPQTSRRKGVGIGRERGGALGSDLTQFGAFGQDAIDNKAFLARGKLTLPVLAIGAEASFGTLMATVMRLVAEDVQEAIVPASGHWVMEENPSATTKLVTDFLKSPR
jgi:pimeloyl-ACP methyl ester carboxylesterase